MISVRDYQEQLLATHNDRLARIERGEVWGSDHANRYGVEEQAIEIRRIKVATTLLVQDSGSGH
ncbi:hypothetical protein Q2941_34660 [Bradyrhizobium sp. UFLA05-153]